MQRKARLIFLACSTVVLIAVSRFVTGDFEHLLSQFWFTAGLLLLVLLSLVDQPFFSKDANVFVNAVTAWVSLFVVASAQRTAIWWIFFGIATYLIVSSYVLMWARAKALGSESPVVQIASRVNRQIGRPECLFSALFLWGAFVQFGHDRLSPLFLFWAVFMILNLPTISAGIAQALQSRVSARTVASGVVCGVIAPRLVEAEVRHDAPAALIGRKAAIDAPDGTVAGSGTILDDRVAAGHRRIQIAVAAQDERWLRLAQQSVSQPTVRIEETAPTDHEDVAGVVGVGSSVGLLCFRANPRLDVHEGDLLTVTLNDGAAAFYQVVSGDIRESSIGEGNRFHEIDVGASQLGTWNAASCRFEPLTWISPPGGIVRRATRLDALAANVPVTSCAVGTVPNSPLPVHVDVNDLVTHNSAILGVTGSGKSYLAFLLIEAMLERHIRVLVLDVSRQHFAYLSKYTPAPLRNLQELDVWLATNSRLGVHQFGKSTSHPQTTAEFTEAAFRHVSKTPLVVGQDQPAAFCIVMEEAHSLIPEWNQTAQKDDSTHVNRTARTVLQGRKYGMGCMIITQRTANVTKTMLNQCNTIFALRCFDQTGLDFLRNYMGNDYANALSTLPDRRAVLVGKASSSSRPVMFDAVNMANRWTATKVLGVAETSIQEATAPVA